MSPYGPWWRIDGPVPLPPKRGLLQAAAKTETVRIIPDVDPSGIDRWINGVEVYPYPIDQATVWDACSAGSDRDIGKAFGTTAHTPQFSAMTVYLPETCTAYKVWDQAAFKARAVAAMSAVEGRAIEHEFLTGNDIPLNPHLSDGNGTFPWGNVATTVPNGVALLENEIAASGKAGVLHVSPAVAIAGARDWLWNMDETDGVIRTLNGTVVVAGTGYVPGAAPLGHPAATAGQEWIYATGPVDIRRSEIFTIPDNVSEALDRGVSGGAGTGRPNSITYRAERYYLVDWDTAVQSAVLVDRCATGCGTPPS